VLNPRADCQCCSLRKRIIWGDGMWDDDMGWIGVQANCMGCRGKQARLCTLGGHLHTGNGGEEGKEVLRHRRLCTQDCVCTHPWEAIERLSMDVCAHPHGKGEGKRYGVVRNKGVREKAFITRRICNC
jgi:hypothetical protein